MLYWEPLSLGWIVVSVGGYSFHIWYIGWWTSWCEVFTGDDSTPTHKCLVSKWWYFLLRLNIIWAIVSLEVWAKDPEKEPLKWSPSTVLHKVRTKPLQLFIWLGIDGVANSCCSTHNRSNNPFVVREFNAYFSCNPLLRAHAYPKIQWDNVEGSKWRNKKTCCVGIQQPVDLSS